MLHSPACCFACSGERTSKFSTFKLRVVHHEHQQHHQHIFVFTSFHSSLPQSIPSSFYQPSTPSKTYHPLTILHKQMLHPPRHPRNLQSTPQRNPNNSVRRKAYVQVTSPYPYPFPNFPILQSLLPTLPTLPYLTSSHLILPPYTFPSFLPSFIPFSPFHSQKNPPMKKT